MKEAQKIAIISGARPNFMKVVPLCKEFAKIGTDYFLVNTGQHFTDSMSSDFFKEFNILPDYNLNPSRGSVIEQFSDITLGLEKVFLKEKPTLVIVVGDVNSTLAGALVACKLNIALAHVEAGLRSYNKNMPEEYNRVAIDHISNILFVTSEDDLKNLKKEGIDTNVYFVGNIMIDTLNMFMGNIKKTDEDFYLCTLHRAENINNKKVFSEILDALEVISKDCKIYLPLHPHTKKKAEEYGLLLKIESIFTILEPLSYSKSLFYQANAKLILTDSGGVQEESSYLGVPCITLRTETERPVTITLGTNSIGGITKQSILNEYRNKDLKRKKVDIPLWDGKTSERIVQIIKSFQDN